MGEGCEVFVVRSFTAAAGGERRRKRVLINVDSRKEFEKNKNTKKLKK